MDRLDRILALVRSHVPDLVLVHKADVPWMRAAGRVLSPFVPDFDTRFTTVLGRTVYLPKPVDQFPRDELARTLAHELIHQLDMQRYGPLFYTSYAAMMPVGRTWRAVWERRAYAVDLMIAWERGGEQELRRVERWLIDVFSGPTYVWMWSGRDAARRFLEPTIAAVRDGSLKQEEPYKSIFEAWKGQ
jgi:hypothetical protein